MWTIFALNVFYEFSSMKTVGGLANPGSREKDP